MSGRALCVRAVLAIILAAAAPIRAFAEDPVAAFVRTGWIHGLPLEVAKGFGPEAVPPLLAMLDDDAESAHWAKIVLTLGAIGDAAAAEPLVAFLEDRFEGEVDDRTWLALLQVPVALGRIGAGPDSRAFDYVVSGTSMTPWRERVRWTHPSLAGESDREMLLVQQSVMGLGLSGRPEALAHLAEMRSEMSLTPDMAPMLSDHLAESIARLEQTLAGKKREEEAAEGLP